MNKTPIFIGTPTNVEGVERLVNNKLYRMLTPPQCGACRRILHDAMREVEKANPYPSNTRMFQVQFLRLELLMKYFDI